MKIQHDVDSIMGKATILSPGLKMIFHPSKKASAFSTALFNLASMVVQVSKNEIQLTIDHGKRLPSTPALTFQHPDCGEIHYMAIPEKQELAPFREMLSGKLSVNKSLSDGTVSRLKVLNNPVDIMVMITSDCPHCPRAVRTVMALAFSNHLISVSILDADKVPELVENYKIRSVPTVILNREMILNRNPAPSELAEMILSSETDQFSAKAFLSYFDTGNIDRAVEKLVNHKKYSVFFLSAWGESTFHLRLGLLLAAEQALDQKPDIFYPVVDGLINLLSTGDVSLKGDTIDLLGRIGHPRAKQPIEALLNDDNKDIVESAQEALINLSYTAAWRKQ